MEDFEQLEPNKFAEVIMSILAEQTLLDQGLAEASQRINNILLQTLESSKIDELLGLVFNQNNVRYLDLTTNRINLDLLFADIVVKAFDRSESPRALLLFIVFNIARLQLEYKQLGLTIKDFLTDSRLGLTEESTLLPKYFKSFSFKLITKLCALVSGFKISINNITYKCDFNSQIFNQRLLLSLLETLREKYNLDIDISIN